MPNSLVPVTVGRDARREQRSQLSLVQKVQVLGGRPRLLAQAPQRLLVPVLGQPVQERHVGVQFNRVPAVRGGDEEALRDAQELGEEVSLPLAVADVLDHRGGEGDVELVVVEGEAVARRLHERQTGMQRFQV